MDHDFWIDKWKQGKTNFHQKAYNDTLLTYFPELHPQPGQHVCVPLCGKTKDMLWLASLGLHVHGIELYEDAVKDFFTENKRATPVITTDANFTHYTDQNIKISGGDFFKFSAPNSVDFVYDRASLVALPPEFRADYVRVLSETLKPGGRYLLIVYEYDPSQMEGPPFSISEKDIHALYGEHFEIALQTPNVSADGDTPNLSLPQMSTAITERVYVLVLREDLTK